MLAPGTRSAAPAVAWIAVTAALALPPPVAADLGDGLLAYYRFENNAADSSGNGNHGVPSGGPGYTIGHLGQAVALDGLNDVVSVPGNLWAADFTTSFWVRTTAIAPTGVTWWQGLGLVDGEVCGTPVGGDFGIAMIDGGHVITDDYKTTSQINDGLFHSVIVTRAITGDSVKTYIDGRLESAHQTIPMGFTGIPWIGVGNNPCDVSFGRLYFPGDIDELRFYDRVLSVEEIAELSETTGSVSAPLGAAERPLLASVFPNPARGRATLTLALPEATGAPLEVYDLRGARVRVVADGQWTPGRHLVEWRGDDDRGRAVGTGVYFVVFRAGTVTERRKLVLIR